MSLNLKQIDYQVKNSIKSYWKNGQISFKDFIRSETIKNKGKSKDESICFGFGMKEESRSNTPDYSTLDIIGFELDKINLDITSIWNKLPSIPFLLCSYLTHSGNGVRLLFRTSEPIENEETYKNMVNFLIHQINRLMDMDILVFVDNSKINGKNGWYIGQKEEFVYFNENSDLVDRVIIDNPRIFSDEKNYKTSKLTDSQKELILTELKNNQYSSYDKWIKLGMGLKNSGFSIEDWKSLSYENVSLSEFEFHWDSFKNNGITLGTLIYFIREINPTFSLNVCEDENDDERIYLINNDHKIILNDTKQKMFIKNSKDSVIFETDVLLIPLYKFYSNDEIVFNFKVIQNREERILTLSGKTFSKDQTLTEFFFKNSISLSLNKKNSHLIYDYLNTHSDFIEESPLGITEERLVHFDFYYSHKDSFIHPLENNIYEHNRKKYILNFNYINEIRKKKVFYKTDTLSENVLNKLSYKLNQSYKNRSVNFLINSYLVSLMVRDRILGYDCNFNDFPLLSLVGSGSTGKTSYLNMISDIFNLNIIQDPTVYNIYRKQSEMKNFPVLVDDLINTEEKENIINLLKNITTERSRDRKREGGIENTVFRNSLIFTTNHPITDEPVITRTISINFNDIEKGTKDEFIDLRDFVKENSFDILISLYQKTNSIDFQNLKQEIKTNSYLLSQEKNTLRESEVYSIVLSIGLICGLDKLFEVSKDEIIKEILHLTGSKQSHNDLVLDGFYNYFEDSNWFETEKPRFTKEEGIPFKDFLEFLKINDYFPPQECNQSKLGKIIKNHRILTTEKRGQYHTTFVILRKKVEEKQLKKVG